MARAERCQRCLRVSTGRDGVVFTAVEFHVGRQTVGARLCGRCWKDWLEFEDRHVKELIDFLFNPRMTLIRIEESVSADAAGG